MELIALELLEKLNNAGFEAYVVGGAVRNKLLGIPIIDYDITTNATPSDIKKVFEGFRFVDSGIKHGTVGVIVEDEVYEITTYRIDGNYEDHRKPENVEFTSSLKEDLKRRDFTINALAFGRDFKIIDYFGGIEDLKKGIIRAVGEPLRRFTEDALRILRAVRFSAVYGFEIEDNTLKAMVECKSYLQDISKERIFSELQQIVCGKNAAKAIYDCREIIFEIIPELRKTEEFNQFSLSHDYDVFNHTLVAMKLSKRRTPTVMWALLFHDIGKPYCLTFDENGFGHTGGHMERSVEITAPILERLKFPTKLKKEVLQLIGDHDKHVGYTKYNVKKYISTYGKEATYNLYYHKVADNLAHSTFGIKRFVKQIKKFKDYLCEIEAGNEVCDIKDLAVTGDDLKNLNLSGVKIGEVKEKLFDEVLKGNVENTKEKLISLAKSFL